MLKKLFAASLLPFLLFFCFSSSAKDKTAIEALAEKTSALQTYQADFELRVQNEKGKKIDFSSGSFAIERPNHFRWQTKQKYQQLIVADGENVFTYDPDLEQVTIQNQSENLADSPLLLMTSNAEELARFFDISQLILSGADNSERDKPDSQLFLLQSKGENSIFESVKILFENGAMVELLMADTLGQQTSVKFSNIKTNQKLDVNLFSFVIPEGVDIVDSRVADTLQTDDNFQMQGKVQGKDKLQVESHIPAEEND